MEPEFITVKGAREHNLRDLSLKLPRNNLICFTGVSGSGKSSFAFDTLFAEGQRRYLESLSSYARQFLGQLAKPDVDQITGLSPSISIQQKTGGWNPRSTVGTITQVYDYLRVVFARVGRQHCSRCGRAIAAQTREQIGARILEIPAGTNVLILAPVVRGQKGEYRDLFEDMIRQGYARARVDGEVVSLAEPPTLARHVRHDIEVVVDRVTVSEKSRARIAEAVENALKLGSGTLIVSQPKERAAGFGLRGRTAAKGPIGDDLLLSSHYACPTCDISFEPPSPQLFSFNSPQGMCPTCQGLGETFDFDPDLVVTHPKKTFLRGAIGVMKYWGRIGRWRRHIFEGVARHVGFDLKKPWEKLPEKAKRALLFGLGDQHVTFEWRWSGGVYRHGGTFDGVLAELREKHQRANSPLVRAAYEKFMRRTRCPDCIGGRLNPQARAVRLGGLNLNEVCAMSIRAAALFFDQLASGTSRSRSAAERRPGATRGRDPSRGRKSADQHGPDIGPETHLTPTERVIAAEALKEIRGRLAFLCDVGLDYLTLDRTAPTLSGGESQRIRLASQIGAGLVGVLYILDEPSIGLHAVDNEKLLDSLERLRDMGNTVIVVEHDEQTMRRADEIVDFGPGPGVRGGRVVAHGDLSTIKKSKRSITGQYLRGDEQIEVPKERRPVSK
jgi:excinuclease ABC subunit A